MWDGHETKHGCAARIALDDGREIALELGSDARQFSLAHDAAIPFVLERSGTYALLLEDNEGLIGGETTRWDIRAGC